MGKIAKEIKRLRELCTHPIIAGTGHGENPAGYSSVTWECSECGSNIGKDTILKEGTLMCFWSNAILKRTCKFCEIQDSDQKRISEEEAKSLIR